MEKRIDAGEASTLALNQVRVALFSVKQEIENRTKERNRALGDLRSLLGLEPDRELEVLADSVQMPTLPEMEAFNLDDLKQHPEYQLRALLADIAQEQTNLAKASRWADIAVEIFFEEEKSVDEPDGLGRDRFFGIGVSIPLPLRSNYRGEVEASRFREKQIYHEMNAMSLQLQNDAEALRSNAAAAYKQASTYKESALKLVEQNHKDINAAYAAGLVDLGEVFRVQEQHLNIQTAQLDLWHELEQILIEWRAATARNLSTHSIGDLSNETK